MSILTPKRVVLLVVAALIGTPLLASYPSPRISARMAYDVKNKEAVLFGGRGTLDRATALVYGSDETWVWNGSSWAQRFPATNPTGRSQHSMVYDSTREQIVMFGGRAESTQRAADPIFLDDTWVWKDDAWTQLFPAQAPSPRHVSGIAYDSDRDRVILFGGNGYAADGRTITAIYDMWEFDGENWSQIGGTMPQVTKPILGYDPGRKQLLLLGVTEGTFDRVMYRYDSATQTWAAVTPEALPTCINEGHLVFQDRTNTLRFVGGLCPTGTPGLEEVFDWNGTNWVKKTMLDSAARGVGQASAYDATYDRIVLYGGSAVGSTAFDGSTRLVEFNEYVVPERPITRPTPRTLAAVATDTITNTVWLFGGLDESQSFYYTDLWGYRNGNWFRPKAEDGPSGCEGPLGAFDSDRARFVVACSGGDVHEWDGSVWKKFDFDNDDDVPDPRQFAAMVYDRNVKKIVLFGGYNVNNYRDDTWTWNGTTWDELDIDGDDRPENRGLMTMWYDPLLERTVLYGGFGRPNIDENVTRHDDMWTFDGQRWSELEVTTPGPRFGPQVAVNQMTGKVLLLGGLRSQEIDEDTITQFFDNDTWEWDGSSRTWTQLAPAHEPSVRQNGMLAWDPIAHVITLFAGHGNGFYRSDVWTWDGLDWTPQLENRARRRAAGR